ncbi:MAG: hypothetical protein KF817_15860 [Phycisphaeraceae bacterium]|nr:hypothetical protein [Phycisphaeraceae bacterium]
MDMRALAAAAIGTISVTGAASAGFVNATVDIHGRGIIAGTITYRVSVHFDSPLDKLLAVFGDVANGNAAVRFASSAPLVQDDLGLPGLSDFFQGAGSPVQGPGDSWVTLGLDPVSANAAFSPGFLGGGWGAAPVIVGAYFEDPAEGWYDANPGTVVNGGSIVIAQFTVPENANFDFYGTVGWQLGGAGGPLKSSFGVATPAPGALALLGLAGILGRRRRR